MPMYHLSNPINQKSRVNLCSYIFYITEKLFVKSIGFRQKQNK